MILYGIKDYTVNGKTELKKTLDTFSTKPVLGILVVGNDPASERYVRNKIKDCKEVGIETVLDCLPIDCTTDFFLFKLRELDCKCDYIIVQKPLPRNIEEYFNSIKEVELKPEKDIDALTKNSIFKACTPYGMIDYINHLGIDLTGKNCVVIGRSELVGKPLAKLLIDNDATVTLCHSKTKDIYKFCKFADIIFCAVGKSRFLDCSRVNPFATIFDVGINFNEDGKMCGDCYNVVSYQDITPVPGGVGLLTRFALIKQIVEDWSGKNAN